jgi:response regulator RpfG family c-di-GMP phosphodiesterase
VRSKETGFHIKRIAEYCRLLALRYGLSEPEADVILKKAGILTATEREEMKTHAERGYHILKRSERRLLRSAAIIAHQHHERWDGGDAGYPSHLKGEGIHLYGRITAIADVFDALANDRVYKKAWELPRIRDMFEAEGGRQFDPDLARVFLKHFDEFVQINDAYRDQLPTSPNVAAGES